MNEEEDINPEEIEIGYQSDNKILLADITGFIALVNSCFENVSAAYRRIQIQKILASSEWHEHHVDSKTKRRVLSHSELIEHKHEKATAIMLAQVNYDVIFVPQGMFKRSEKRYDILLLKDSIMLKADLKCIFSKNPNTIGGRIREGSDQASRVVLHICSDVSPKILIQGLRIGCYKNTLLKSVFVFYKNKFYLLDKELIVSKRIFHVLK